MKTRFVVLAFALACGDGQAPEVAVQLGRVAFEHECASCHASRDGFDLAVFDFPDTTIIRRAIAHVPHDTAQHIARYIRSLDVTPLGRFNRVFQPGGRLLESDEAFAVHLFGADEWPVGLTDEELRAIDPRDVPVAIPFPRWSSEETDTDWLPDVAIADELLDRRPPSPTSRSARAYLDRYYADRSLADLRRAVGLLTDALKNPNNEDSPCLVRDDPELTETCFNAHRWIASLAAQHVLRTGEMAPEFHLAWWEVGDDLTRRLDEALALVGDVELNRAAWTYLGWVFAPGDGRALSVAYNTRLLADAGFPRHAVFNSLRAMVDRTPGDRIVYSDLQAAVTAAPPWWTYGIVRFGFTHFTNRLDSGDWPYDTFYSIGNLNFAIIRAREHVSGGRLQELEAMYADLRARLEEGPYGT